MAVTYCIWTHRSKTFHLLGIKIRVSAGAGRDDQIWMPRDLH